MIRISYDNKMVQEKLVYHFFTKFGMNLFFLNVALDNLSLTLAIQQYKLDLASIKKTPWKLLFGPENQFCP